ncbi:MAG TPA: hypothetical protein VFS10_11015 [Pyrinomonadaceae bacterium]|nr:hypothetical protein [Pyrinomonadaceae bacterium]
MSTELQRSPDAEPQALDADDLFPSSRPDAETATLGSLPLGARLVLRCRKDWRTATVAFIDETTARVVLSVGSPSGHTYRLRRPFDSPLTHDGPIPVLGEGHWRAGLARYDVRW